MAANTVNTRVPQFQEQTVDVDKVDEEGTTERIIEQFSVPLLDLAQEQVQPRPME